MLRTHIILLSLFMIFFFVSLIQEVSIFWYKHVLPYSFPLLESSSSLSSKNPSSGVSGLSPVELEEVWGLLHLALGDLWKLPWLAPRFVPGELIPLLSLFLLFWLSSPSFGGSTIISGTSGLDFSAPGGRGAYERKQWYYYYYIIRILRIQFTTGLITGPLLSHDQPVYLTEILHQYTVSGNVRCSCL